MNGFKVHDAQTAPQASRELLQKVEQKYGFLPNLMGVLAESPAALQAYAQVSEIFEGSSLTPVEKQVVLLSVSFFNECDYCMSAHSTLAGMVDMPQDVLQALRTGEPIADPKLEALRRFTTRVVERRGWLDEAEVGAFFDAGYTRQNLLEVLVGVTQKTLSNYTNHVAGTPLDDAFASQKWTRAEKREAVSVTA